MFRVSFLPLLYIGPGESRGFTLIHASRLSALLLLELHSQFLGFALVSFTCVGF
jgi:hypothetical protein